MMAMTSSPSFAPVGGAQGAGALHQQHEDIAHQQHSCFTTAERRGRAHIDTDTQTNTDTHRHTHRHRHTDTYHKSERGSRDDNTARGCSHTALRVDLGGNELLELIRGCHQTPINVAGGSCLSNALPRPETRSCLDNVLLQPGLGLDILAAQSITEDEGSMSTSEVRSIRGSEEQQTRRKGT